MTRRTKSLPASSLYPIVHDITQEEYETNPQSTANCCCPQKLLSSHRASSSDAEAHTSLRHDHGVHCDNLMSSSTPKRYSTHHYPIRERSLNLESSPHRAALQHSKAISLLDMCVTSTFSSDNQTNLAIDSGEEANEELVPVFDDVYVLTRQIFQCDTCQVWECVHRKLGQRFAVKIMDTPSTFDNNNNYQLADVDDDLHEVEMFQALQLYPNVVQIVDIFHRNDRNNRTYVVMELLTGGNLLSRVIQQRELDEDFVKRVARDLLTSLVELHADGICHNDLQPSNILLNEHSTAKLADFGKAARMHDDRVFSPCGLGRQSLVYTAPEVLQGSRSTTASDMWSVGATVYFCLCGKPPFTDEMSGRPDLSLVLRADFSFPYYLDISRTTKQFVSNLLLADPTIRLTAEEALAHPWLRDNVADPNTLGTVGTRAALSLRRFHATKEDTAANPPQHGRELDMSIGTKKCTDIVVSKYHVAVKRVQNVVRRLSNQRLRNKSPSSSSPWTTSEEDSVACSSLLGSDGAVLYQNSSS